MDTHKEKEIDLKQLYMVIKKRLWVVLLTTVLLTALGGYYISIPETPLYESSTRLYVQTDKDFLNNVRVIIREPVVMEEVINQLELNRSAEALRNQIKIEMVESSTVIRLSVVDRDPVQAANIANAIVTAYNEIARGTVFHTTILVLTKGEVNGNPINPQSNRALYIAFIAGIVLGIGTIFLMDSLDDSVKSDREIEQLLGITVLGSVSRIKRRDIKKRPIQRLSLPLRGETIGS